MPLPEPFVATFVWVLGLCVGSFLNVVAYRLPLGLSVSRPTWSFCPLCRHSLAARDNIPLVSWLLLLGRCRQCRAPISARYPLVEAVTGLTFLLVYRLLFVEHARLGLDQTHLVYDAPLLLAWLTLAAAMLVCCVMDLTSYTVDTRVTDFAMFAGVLLNAIWPRPDFMENAHATPGSSAYSAAFLAGIASLVMLWLTVWREPEEIDAALRDAVDAKAANADADTPSAAAVELSPNAAEAISTQAGVPAMAESATSAPHADSASQERADSGPPTKAGRSPLGLAALGLLLFCGLSVALIAAPAFSGNEWVGVLMIGAFVALFLGLTLASGSPSEADEEIQAMIDEEAPDARRVVFGELLWLTPILIAALAGFLLVERSTLVVHYWTTLTTWAPLGSAWPMLPFAGAAYAIHGAIVAAAVGWATRIFFTLLFGKEAFGVGDIYILAAAGAVTGWDIALLGALLSVGIAMASWMLGLLIKQHAMIPFGPPLALGFLMALWLSRPFAAWIQEPLRTLEYARHERPEMLLLLAGVLMVGGAVAVLIARLARRAIEGDEQIAAHEMIAGGDEIVAHEEIAGHEETAGHEEIAGDEETASHEEIEGGNEIEGDERNAV